MDMADLIATRRKEKNMTQKQLADKLGVTDKAVSKWERGNGKPDIVYLEPLAKVLNITVSELLSGVAKEKTGDADEESGEDTIVKKALYYANSIKIEKLAQMLVLICWGTGLLGIISTVIVDFALNGMFTWSLLVIIPVVFLCLCTLPVLLFKTANRRLNFSLAATCVLVLPFLAILNYLLQGNWFFSIAVPSAISGIVVMWFVRGVFATKLNIWNKQGITYVVAGICTVVVNLFVDGALGNGERFDVWDIMTVAIFIVASVACFVVGWVKKNQVAQGE